MKNDIKTREDVFLLVSGFYKKVKKEDGSSEIKSLDLDKMEYRDRKSAKFDVLEQTKTIDNLEDRYEVLVGDKGKAGEFYRKNFAALFAYVSHRIPEISDKLYKIDDGVKGGFGWAHGPFQMWDALGVKKGVEMMKAEGKEPAAWVNEML